MVLRRESGARWAYLMVTSFLGDKDQAFEQLERNFEERSGLLIYLNVLPQNDHRLQTQRLLITRERLSNLFESSQPALFFFQ